MFSIFSVLEGIIAAAPQAVQLWHKVAPLISQRVDISEDEIAAVNEMVPVAHATVATINSAVGAIVGAHAPAETPTAGG